MSENNNRDHFRVEMTVPVRWKILNEDEIQILKKGMGDALFKQRGIPSPIDAFLDEVIHGSKDERILLALQLLNNKLDYIIENLLSRPAVQEYSQDYITEISASGLKFSSDEKLEEGMHLKMELILPGIVQYNMELVAEIIRITENNEKYINAARIVHIRDDARDSIIKLVFQKQRMDIRNIKNQEDKN